MGIIISPNFIEKSLFDYMKEFVELKILVGSQDIIMQTESKIHRDGGIEFINSEFNEENIDKICKSKRIYKRIYLNILVQESLIESMKKSFLETKKLMLDLINKGVYEKDEFNIEMTKNGYVPNILENTCLDLKLFTHDATLCVPFIVNYNNSGLFTFRIYTLSLDSY